MRTRLYSIILLFTLVYTSVNANNQVSDTITGNDSIPAKKKFSLDNVLEWPVIGVIYPSLSPETGIAIGLGIQGTWNMPESTTPSSLRLTGTYTQYKQWRIQTTGALYMAGKTPWLLQFNMQYRDYPDRFYGIGNTPGVEAINYDSKRFNTTLEPLLRLPHNWSIGPMTDIMWERTNIPDLDSLFKGHFTTFMWGLGVSTLYDTRDEIYYPTRGMFFKFKGFYCEPALGADCRVWNLEADYRHFVTLWKPTKYRNDFDKINKSLIFAYQVELQTVLTDGSNYDIPFQMLPTLGGDETLRGIRANMFRDNTLWAVQSELRFPIFRVIHGVAFASVGDVYNTQNWNWTTPKVGYGLGLRVTVNRAHLNLRCDVARNNIDKAWNTWNSYSFYITASEAF